MLRLSELNGRAVVDMAAAEKLGEIDEAVLDPESRRVVGFMITRGSTLLGGGQRMVFAASAVHSVGPDAVTVHGATLEHAEGTFPGLPRRRDIVGRKIVGHSGKMYGHIHDVLIDPSTGEIIGYSMEDAPRNSLDGIFGAPRTGADLKYVRSDADLRVGSEIVVVPDEAIVHHNATETEVQDLPSTTAAWNSGAALPARASAWVDQRAQPGAAAPVAPETISHHPEASPVLHHDPAAEPAYEEMTFGTPSISPPLREGENRPF